MKRPKKPQFNLAQPEEYFTDDVFIREIPLLPGNEIDITRFIPGNKYIVVVDAGVDYWDEVHWEASINEYSTGKRKNPQYDYQLLYYNERKAQYEAELAQYNSDIVLYNKYLQEQNLKKAQVEKDKKEAEERKLFEELRKKYEKENQNT